MLELSPMVRDVLLSSITELIDSAGSAGRVDIKSATGLLLASLRLSDPVASPPVDGVITFGPIEESVAIATGVATDATFFDGVGDAIFKCDVGDVWSSAVLRFDNVQFQADQPVSISSFKIEMPAS